MKTNGLDTAFPMQIEDASTVQFVCSGLTKREYFAALAMQGICGDGIPGSHHNPITTAELAVEYADALIAELNKEDSGDD